ncbi:MAG TPA: ABATE domain-containing protein [Nevskiaceae bacterium]|nr:ABATE domain-containing protein [Nevskiaceae bacterium]
MPASSAFFLFGEPLAVDLVNTRARRGATLVDALDSPTALAAWLKKEASHVAWQGQPTRTDLIAVQALRSAIDTLLRTSLSMPRPAPAALQTAVDALNNVLTLPILRPRLRWTPSGPRVMPPGADARRAVLLNALAMSAVTVLTGPDAARLRECAHPDCVLLFVARNARRRWCSATTCGNRARVARHYHQQRSQQGERSSTRAKAGTQGSGD